MKFLGLDGRQHAMSLTDYVGAELSDSKSSLHIRARILLHETFRFDKILEEVYLPGSNRNGKNLYADFFIPTQSIIVEVQGEQHYKYNKFFFKDKLAFAKAKQRDKDKSDWCELNKIKLIEFPFGETDEQWRERLR